MAINLLYFIYYHLYFGTQFIYIIINTLNSRGVMKVCLYWFTSYDEVGLSSPIFSLKWLINNYHESSLKNNVFSVHPVIFQSSCFLLFQLFHSVLLCFDNKIKRYIKCFNLKSTLSFSYVAMPHVALFPSLRGCVFISADLFQPLKLWWADFLQYQVMCVRDVTWKQNL